MSACSPSRSRKNGMERKVALVIGAGDALGGAIAKRFARENFRVCVVRRNGNKLAPLVDEIRACGAAGIDAVLIGERLMREADAESALRRLRHGAA